MAVTAADIVGGEPIAVRLSTLPSHFNFHDLFRAMGLSGQEAYDAYDRQILAMNRDALGEYGVTQIRSSSGMGAGGYLIRLNGKDPMVFLPARAWSLQYVKTAIKETELLEATARMAENPEFPSGADTASMQVAMAKVGKAAAPVVEVVTAGATAAASAAGAVIAGLNPLRVGTSEAAQVKLKESEMAETGVGDLRRGKPAKLEAPEPSPMSKPVTPPPLPPVVVAPAPAQESAALNAISGAMPVLAKSKHPAEEVKRLQQALVELGYLAKKDAGKDSVDGYFGAKTEEAVRAFQQAHKETEKADGIVGPKTWNALRAALKKTVSAEADLGGLASPTFAESGAHAQLTREGAAARA